MNPANPNEFVRERWLHWCTSWVSSGSFGVIDSCALWFAEFFPGGRLSGSFVVPGLIGVRAGCLRDRSGVFGS